MTSSPTWSLPSRPIVEITRAAHDLIIATVRDDTHHSLEIGGALVGSALEQRTITRATGPGPTVQRRRNTMRFDWLVDLQQQAGNDACLGLWHSHPNGDTGRMSRTDIDTFRGLRSKLYRPLDRLIAIIVEPSDPRLRTSRKGWTNPRLTAWLIGAHDYKLASLRIADTPSPRRGRPRQTPTSPAPTRGASTTRPKIKVFIAKTKFTTEYGGERVQIAAGEHIVPGHQIAKQHPDKFTEQWR